jgi:hypothetical protein
MGSLAIVTADRLSSNITESTVLAASVVVAQTELGLFVGNDLIADLGQYKAIASAVEKCLNGLRDSGNVAPALAANFNLAQVDPTAGDYGVKDVVVTLNSVTGLPTGEKNVTIIVGGLFQATGTASVTSAVNSALDKIIEDRLKKAA